MLEPTIRIDAEQRNLLYRFLDHYAEAIETLDDPERAGVGRAVLEALGPEIDGDQALYELPTSPEVRAFLTECRDCEWETIDCGDRPTRSGLPTCWQPPSGSCWTSSRRTRPSFCDPSSRWGEHLGPSETPLPSPCVPDPAWNSFQPARAAVAPAWVRDVTA